MILDDYKTWLRKQKYTDSTIAASLKVLRRLNTENPKPNRVDKQLLKRYLRYVKETRCNPAGTKFTDALGELGIHPSTPRELCGSRDRKPLSFKEFHAIKARCQKSTHLASAMVAFYMMSGLRPRDFLFTRVKEVPFVQDRHFFDQYADRTFLYEILSPSFTWAYRKLLAAAQREAAALDIDADLGTLYRSRLELL